VLPGESRKAVARLEEARQHLAEQKWSEAVEVLQTLVDGGDDELVPAGHPPGRDIPHLIQARRLAQLHLAGLPAPALALYRQKLEPQAGKWLEQGLAERDPRWLRKVIEEAFCTRAAEKALDGLGDLAFERGAFDEADLWWRLLAPFPPVARPEQGPPQALAYPDPSGDVARVRAKQLLAHIFQAAGRGDSAPLLEELRTYRKLHPREQGKLAGTQGTYADLLQEMIAGAARPAGPLQQSWASLGGDASRGLIATAPADLPGRLGQLCRQPAWQFDLAERVRLEEARNRPRPFFNSAQSAFQAARSMAFHPVVTENEVLVSDGRYVTGYDIVTGAATEWYDVARFNGGVKVDLTLPAAADLRHTLTVAEGCVFARLGVAEVVRSDQKEKPESFLVCLSLVREPGRERFRWQARPSVVNDNAIFEGAPVVQDGLVYIASTRFSSNAVISSIHCYPVHANGTPPLRWRKEVCETPDAGVETPRRRHHLLTLAGPYVVYCSHSGAIVALERESGKRAWAVRYRVRPRPGPEQRLQQPGAVEDEVTLDDLAPCLFAGGRLYVAPSDADRLLCMDVLTGRILWERDRLRVVHLLGVGQGRLIFTTPGGLRAVEAAGGGDLWALPDGSGLLPPLGRGLLVGDLVLWPTVRGVFAVRQADGLQADNPTLLDRVPPGNLAYGNGCLAVADRSRLTVFAAGARPAFPLPGQTHRPSDSGREESGESWLCQTPGSSPPWPWQRGWQMALDPGEVLLNCDNRPTLSLPDFFCTARTKPSPGLICRAAATGQRRWEAPLPFVPAVLAVAGERIVVGGDQGIVCLQAQGGQRVWALPASGIVRSLRLAGGRLYWLEGERRLLAVDPGTGVILWTRQAPGVMFTGSQTSSWVAHSEGRFVPAFQVCGQTLLIGTASGRCWLLDTASGVLIRQTPASPEAVRCPFVLVDDRWAAVVVGRQRLILLELPDGKERWRVPLPEHSLLGGEPIRLLAGKQSLLVLLPLNIGYQLQRLDLATGKPLWERPPVFAAPGRIVVDDTAVYWAEEGLLSAWSLKDGRRQWEQTLMRDDFWELRRWGDGLLAWPASVSEWQIRFRWLAVSLEWKIGPAVEALSGAGWPLEWRDAATGRLRQRWNFQAKLSGRESARRLAISPDWSFFPQLRLERSLQPARLTVQAGSRGLVLARDGQVWELQASSND